MKTLTLLTVLAAAIPAAAYADPPQQTYDRDRAHAQDRDRAQDHFRHDHYDRFAGSRWETDFHGRWRELVRGNSATGRREFVVGTKTGYHTFRLQSLRGDPMIHRIVIRFADGTSQVVDVNAALPAGAGEVIDLQGDERRVGRVVVEADPRSRGAYVIYGS